MRTGSVSQPITARTARVRIRVILGLLMWSGRGFASRGRLGKTCQTMKGRSDSLRPNAPLQETAIVSGVRFGSKASSAPPLCQQSCTRGVRFFVRYCRNSYVWVRIAVDHGGVGGHPTPANGYYGMMAAEVHLKSRAFASFR